MSLSNEVEYSSRSKYDQTTSQSKLAFSVPSVTIRCWLYRQLLGVGSLPYWMRCASTGLVLGAFVLTAAGAGAGAGACDPRLVCDVDMPLVADPLIPGRLQAFCVSPLSAFSSQIPSATPSTGISLV